MAEIKGFKALRFTSKAGSIKEVCCPPYDIIPAAEREEYFKQNDYNIIRLESPEQTEEGYNGARDTLNKWINDGILAQDENESIYIYEEKFSVKGVNYAFKGFTCYAQLHEFSEGIILPHEQTLSKAKTDRLNLLKTTGCSFSQIYSLYSDPSHKTSGLLEELSKGEPDNSFTDNEGVTHNLWCVTDESAISELQKQFADRKLYIADGHHRYETALNYRRYASENSVEAENKEYIMMFLVDMENDGLVVFPTHRIVKNLPDFDTEKVIEKCKEHFFVEEISAENANEFLDKAYAENKKAYVMLAGDKAYAMTLRDISVMDEILANDSIALRRLDVSVLHSLVLEKLFGIDKENMANQVNLSYTRSATEAIAAAKTANCAFLLNPTRVDEIAAVAAAGEKMPQKSTYFYPKLTTGLVINKVK